MELLLHMNHTLHQTIVIVTHAAEIAARANRTVLMRDGAIAE
jgi:ABC-type lipoprotein export system ATPase subunit